MTNVQSPPSLGNSRKKLAQAIAIFLLLGLVAAIVWSYLSDGLVFQLFRRDLDSAAKVEVLKTYFVRLGPTAPFVYVLFVIVEVVVAPIPGLILYAPGGLLFGGFVGGLLSLIGNTLGAGIACQLVRLFGSRIIYALSEVGGVQRISKQLESRGMWIILLLRINPLTSSDLVSYTAGVTKIPTWKVMLGTLIGMAPLCWGQSYLSKEAFERFPALIYPLAIAAVIYVVCVILILRSMFSRQKPTSEKADP